MRIISHKIETISIQIEKETNKIDGIRKYNNLIKNSLEELGDRFKRALKKRISQLEERSMRLTNLRKRKKKRMKKNSLRDLWGPTKNMKICKIGVPT